MLRLIPCILLLPIAARGDWHVKSSKEEPSPNESVVHRQTVLGDDETAARATLDCVTFPAAAATLEVIDQPEPPRRELAEIMKARGALAGINGGYFDPEDAPVGLLISGRKVIAPLRKAKLLSGVLFATGDKIDIARLSRFTQSRKIRAAVQCGPILVEQGAPVAGLNDSRIARRTFAVVDGKGQAALGISSALSLAQLGRVLTIPNALGAVKPARALNLDGGSSSAFWFAGTKRVISVPELKTVRDVIAIVARPDR